jgi:protein SCO1/2
LLLGCNEHFPLKQDIKITQHEFLNQDSILLKFPEVIKDKVTLLAMIYTHCSDICPMKTHNKHLIYEKLDKSKQDKLQLVIITIDPERDKPYVLKDYASIREYDLSNWLFLTEDEKNTKEVMQKFGITAVKTDSSYDNKGNLSYFITHTDRITLIDNLGYIRKTYSGSVIDIDEVSNDLNYF